jgi:signal transduction histidine kinase
MFEKKQQPYNTAHRHQVKSQSVDAFTEHPTLPIQPVNPSSKVVNQTTKSLQTDHDELSYIENFSKALSFVCTSDIVAGVIHEINNPLQVIMGRTQIARLGKNIEDSLQIIEKQVMRIAKIMRSLNTLVHHHSSDIAPYSPKEVLEDVLELITSQLNKQNIQVNVNLEASPTVYGQQSVFRQILLSSLLNAKKRIGYSGQIFIRIKSSQKNQFVLEICDTAPIISSDITELLSQPLMGALGKPQATEHIELIALFQAIRQQGGKAVFKESAVGNLLEIQLPMQGNTDGKANTTTTPQNKIRYGDL